MKKTFFKLLVMRSEQRADQWKAGGEVFLSGQPDQILHPKKKRRFHFPAGALNQHLRVKRGVGREHNLRLEIPHLLSDQAPVQPFIPPTPQVTVAIERSG